MSFGQTVTFSDDIVPIKPTKDELKDWACIKHVTEMQNAIDEGREVPPLSNLSYIFKCIDEGSDAS